MIQESLKGCLDPPDVRGVHSRADQHGQESEVPILAPKHSTHLLCWAVRLGAKTAARELGAGYLEWRAGLRTAGDTEELPLGKHAPAAGQDS